MKAADLLDTLDNAVNACVGPFMTAQGARHTTGLSNFDGYPGPSSITQRPHSEVSGLFWWVNRFEVGRTIFDIGYGDREALIETMLYYQGIKDRLKRFLVCPDLEPGQRAHGRAAWAVLPVRQWRNQCQ